MTFASNIGRAKVIKMQMFSHGALDLKQIARIVSVKRRKSYLETAKEVSQLTPSQLLGSCTRRLPSLGKKNWRTRNCSEANSGHHHNSVSLRWQMEGCWQPPRMACYWESPELDEGTWQQVLPTALPAGLLNLLHDSPVVGHLGVSKTPGNVRERFYWNHYRLDVSEWCHKCDRCFSCTMLESPWSVWL